MKIAIIDSGINPQKFERIHLAKKLYVQNGKIVPDYRLYYPNNHGTVCASVIDKYLAHDISLISINVIKTRNSSFSSTEIIYLIERVNSLLNHCILQYQAIQRETDEIEMHVVLKKDYETWKDTVKETFEQNIVNEELKEIEWNFYFEDAIYPAPTTGKLSYFIEMM